MDSCIHHHGNAEINFFCDYFVPVKETAENEHKSIVNLTSEIFKYGIYGMLKTVFFLILFMPSDKIRIISLSGTFYSTSFQIQVLS